MSEAILNELEPFREVPWRGEEREAAEAFWNWHIALRTATVPPAEVEALVAQVKRGASVSVLPASITEPAYAACTRHKLPFDLLSAQVEAAALQQPLLRFDDATALRAFSDAWAAPHGRLLAKLAGLTLRFQEPYIDELAYGFFLTRRLVALPQDLADDLLFIPTSELEYAGVTVDDLRRGTPGEQETKLLWKQSVRARDALAQGRTLYDDLDRRFRRPFKRAWLTALEVLNIIARRNFDVWSAPVELTAKSRLAITLQSIFGRTSFR